MSVLVSTAAFRARFPNQFALTQEELIQGYVDLCESDFCEDADRWGSMQREAIMHLTAHFCVRVLDQKTQIASNAVGITSGTAVSALPASDDDLSTTVYGQMYRMIRDSNFLAFGMA